MKLTLLVVDEDKNFLDLLLTYVRESPFDKRLLVKVFTQKAVFETFLQTAEPFHILVAKSEMIAGLTIPQKPTCTAVFQDSSLELDQIPNSNQVSNQITPLISYQWILKFQPFNLMLDQLVAMYMEQNQLSFQAVNIQRTTDEITNTQIISVYSAVGGSGKTTVAANLAKQLAFLENKVFYLNLELISSISMFPSATGSQSFSQLLYYIHADPEQILARFDRLKKVDPFTKVEYLDPIVQIQEMEEMTAEVVEQLLQMFMQSKAYDFIIIDLESSLNERIVKALSICDEIVWIVLDDMHCLQKTRLLKDELRARNLEKSIQWSNKIYYLMNKYTGLMRNDFADAEIHVGGQLPYIPQWKSVHSVEQLMSESIFNRHLNQWFHSRNSVRNQENSVNG